MNGEEPFHSEKKLSARLDIEFALQATGLGVWELDTATSQVIWDDRCRQLFGLADDNLLTYEEAIRYIHRDDVDRVNEAVQRTIGPASDGFYDETFRTIGDDGKLRWVRFYGRAYFEDDGKLYRFSGVAQELTQHKTVEEREIATRDRAERQQRILETISATTPDLMYVFDLNYRFTYANRALLNMWGSTWENSIGKSLLEIGYEPWHAEMHEREIDQVIATKSSIRGEVSFPHATLGRRVYDYVFSPVLNEQGEVEAIAGTTRDITDLMVARQALEENQTALSNAIEVAELGTWNVNLGKGTVTMSPRVADWFGFESQVVDAETWLGRIAERDRERVRYSLFDSRGQRSRTHYDQEYTIVNPANGLQRVIHAIGRIYSDEDGQVLRVEGTAQDITASRQLTMLLEQQVQRRTQELEQANELLVRSNNNLQNFAYVASHDLQEPLRKIQQFGNLLAARQTSLSLNEKTYIERMRSAASRMSLLISDLLDYAGISGKRESNERVSLNRVVDQVLNTMDLAINEAGAQVHVGPLPEISGNASQLAQLFQNLIGNAIKFHRPSVPPVVHIAARTVPASTLPASAKPQIAAFYHRIDVEDNGIGFDEQYLDRIFQVFQRLHGRSEFSGTGIGLAICEGVVTNHGGSITASSEPGVGSTFTIFLPVES